MIIRILVLNFSFVFLGFNEILNAQYLSPKVISSANGVGQSANVKVYYTVGETIYTSLSSSGNKLTQGFHQPYFKGCSLDLGTDSASICQGDSLAAPTGFESYAWSNGDSIQYISPSQSGLYFCNAIKNSCTATDSIYITILPANDTTEYLSSCSAISWYGILLEATGHFEVRYQNASGCWAKRIVEFTRLNSDSSTIEVVQCESFTWHGNTYTQSGTYTWSGTNAVGCDSVVTLNLTIIPQPAQPPTACYQIAEFNTQTCSWDLRGTQPVQPPTACYQIATFNNQTCSWVLTGTQPTQPPTACYQTATFNNQTCSWVLTGSPAPAIVTTASACGSYTWSVNGQSYTNSGNYTYSVNCRDYALNLSITPNTSITTTASACGAYIWSVNGQTYTQTGTYTSVNGCRTDNLNLTINSNSVAPVSASASSTSITAGTSVTLSVSGGTLGTGASWKWYSGSCGSTLVGTGASISVSPTSTTTYFVRAEGLCSPTACASVTVNVQPSTSCGPTGITSNRAMNTVCKGTSITLSVQGVLGTGGSWKWYTGGCGVGTVCATGSSITVTPSANTTYFVRSMGGVCGTTVCQSISVIVNSAPVTPGAISGTTAGLCSATAAQYSVTPVVGATSYTWTVPTGAVITSGQGTNIISVNFIGASSPTCSSTSTISVVARNSCGTSATRKLTIGLRPAKATAINGSGSACRLTTVNYSVTPIAGATSYTWTVPSGWIIQLGQGTTNVTIKTGTCSGSIGVTANSICGNNGCFTKYITLTSCARYAEDNSTLEEETIAVDNISIYPNPGMGEYTLATPALDEHAVVSIYAMDGRLINKLTIPAHSQNVKIDLTDKANGIYLVRFVSANLSQDLRVIKQ